MDASFHGVFASEACAVVLPVTGRRGFLSGIGAAFLAVALGISKVLPDFNDVELDEIEEERYLIVDRVDEVNKIVYVRDVEGRPLGNWSSEPAHGYMWRTSDNRLITRGERFDA